MSEVKQLIAAINDFREAREWRQFHNPKDLALSLSLESAELLETFQWKTSQEALATNQQAMKEELADVLIYALMLADDLSLDVTTIIQEKLDQNNMKYPVKKSTGKKDKYTTLE
ncbi:NTP pyrophosphatase (non-canonical NTP hydrolase) [Streptohalobacillus salinus]|uniref:NTP pyrophosphatase (Non-canonical NTP hydrolase) n=1 Tax=Streptohalobacillus salinus TaxID=621096 RepID=A0A2V3VZ93_9BACI|nr:nucleotide pyrophosphohydrolase [Streptohalobacillus salinus]PXW87357.1 NTP pyrophosphatase (non-canonical NTP hydrolase) [Streptohalobacillus salinus]